MCIEPKKNKNKNGKLIQRVNITKLTTALQSNATELRVHLPVSNFMSIIWISEKEKI